MSDNIKSIRVPEKISCFLPYVLFVFALSVFIAAATCNLAGYFPFRGIDEYYKFQVALKFMRIFLGQDASFDLSSFSADPREPFLMYLEYVGWAPLYIAVAMMSVFGKALGYFFVFRFSMVLVGALTLCSIWCVLRRWFNEWTAALTVFFVGCNFSYIQAIQHGFFCEVTFQVFGLWLGLMLCLTGQRRKNGLLLYLGFFVFGLTLWAKIMFVAYMFAAPAAFWALGRKRREFIDAVFPARRNALLACAAFVSGALPFVWFNVRHGFPTLRLIFSRMSGFSQVHDNWNNSDVFGNLLRRIHDFYMYLSGNVLFEDLNDAVVSVYAVLFVCAFVWGVVTLFGRRSEDGLRLRLRVLFVFYAAVLVLTCFVPNRHRVFQILVMVPFAGILCSLFLVRIARVRSLVFLPVLICGLWFGGQLDHFYSFSRDYLKNGQFYGLLKGEPEFLVAWLRSGNIKRVLCTDPLGRVLCTVGPEWDGVLSDLNERNMTPDWIADEMRRFISESTWRKSYMLIYGDEESAAYTKIKDSAESHGITVSVVDSKALRNNPAHTFLLCRIFISDANDPDAPVRSGAVK